jgi:hypothetical protein
MQLADAIVAEIWCLTMITFYLLFTYVRFSVRCSIYRTADTKSHTESHMKLCKRTCHGFVSDRELHPLSNRTSNRALNRTQNRSCNQPPSCANTLLNLFIFCIRGAIHQWGLISCRFCLAFCRPLQL